MAFNAEKCLKFQALSDNCTISIPVSKADSSHYQFSKDGSTWQNDSITLNIDEVCYVKGTNYPAGSDSSSITFTLSAPAKIVSGNLMSLIDDGAGAATEITQKYGFKSLFEQCANLKSIPSGMLSAQTLTDSCYSDMFRSCTGLTSIPSKLISAKNMRPYCCSGMFGGCKNITSIPEDFFEDNIVLDRYCFHNMFVGSGIQTIPKGLLPTTTLVECCYFGMFQNCKSLQSVPSGLLPATTLKQSCYKDMFKNCSNLTEIGVNFTDWSNGTNEWVYNVAATGTFYCNEGLPIEYGTSRIPTGWTVKYIKPLKTHGTLKVLGVRTGVR